MARYLVTLSLGPVQSLIGAARRTRDLWCGSWLLSEAARAAARVLHQRHPGCLIFPCPEHPDDNLRPQNQPGDDANIANILRAEVELPDDAAVRGLCRDARLAAAARVTRIGESVHEDVRKRGWRLRDDVWETQIGDILEGFAAWSQMADGNGGYRDASRRLGGALAARKTTRDFHPCSPSKGLALPKSSLDGALETVLPRWSAGDPLSRRLRLTAGLAAAGGEQLDALGVIKRMGGDAEQFTAWPRIAADTWIQRLTDGQRDRLRAACEPLVKVDMATRVHGNDGAYEALPFDGHLLYAFRLENELARVRPERERDERPSPAVDALRGLRNCLQDIRSEKAADGAPTGSPAPYAAVLKADGDRMGHLLSRADSADRSREISRALHRFASRVRKIVREHQGHAIYAGGDDVLALVPLAKAVDCSRALARSFETQLGAIAGDMGLADGDRPTLSVGLGIGHVIEPLSALRNRADHAERDAKGDGLPTPRNALAIRLGIRSGTEVCWRAQWCDEVAFEALRRFVSAYRTGELSTRVAYDLREIHRRLDRLANDHGATRGMRAAEVERLLDRARRDGGQRSVPDDLRRLLRERAENRPRADPPDRLEKRDETGGSGSLAELADSLIIARWLAARTANDLGEES